MMLFHTFRVSQHDKVNPIPSTGPGAARFGLNSESRGRRGKPMSTNPKSWRIWSIVFRVRKPSLGSERRHERELGSLKRRLWKPRPTRLAIASACGERVGVPIGPRITSPLLGVSSEHSNAMQIKSQGIKNTSRPSQVPFQRIYLQVPFLRSAV